MIANTDITIGEVRERSLDLSNNRLSFDTSIRLFYNTKIHENKKLGVVN